MQMAVEIINSFSRVFVEAAWLILIQSSVLIAILFVADFLLKRKVRAVFRYWLWTLVLVKLVIPATLSSPVSIGRLIFEPIASVSFIGAKKQLIYKTHTILPSSGMTAGPQIETPSASSLTQHIRPIAPLAKTDRKIMPLTWQGGIFLLWLTIVSVMLVLLLQRIALVCGLVRQAKDANKMMQETLEFCCRKTGVRGPIGLKISPSTASPAVCGLLRPFILLPEGLDLTLSPKQMRAVLIHELAHIKRDDLWINMLQTFLQIAYFYHPLLWLANRIIRRVREQAVDEYVLVSLGRSAQEYPITLLSIARLAFRRPVLSLRLIGVIESKNALAERIKRMLTRPVPKTTKLGLAGTFIVLMTGLLIIPMAKSASEEPEKGLTFEVEKGEPPHLKEVFANNFLIGAAADGFELLTPDLQSANIFKKHFNTITTENVLKWDVVHPEPDKYNFRQADKLVEFGQKNKLFIVGHVLIGQEQAPEWVFKNQDGSKVDRETLLKRMREHILTVVGHYKGRIHAWEVVNEAMGSDDRLRKTKWYEILGADYITKAFEYAYEADPGAELYYTDYNVLSKDTANIIRLVSVIKNKGLRIDGIGIEAHWNLDYPSLNDIDACINAFAKAGIKVMISEMDVTVLPYPGYYKSKDISQNPELRKKLDPYADQMPGEMQNVLAKRYYDLFTVFHKNAGKIGRITFWGVNDHQSWLNSNPIQRTDYPLLFDRNYQPKPAFFAVVKTAQI